jgi:catechol 2,3-dioxygenase-like lactoylglutathione lyase family enzyme
MLVKRLYHTAFRCANSQATVTFYTKVLGLKYAAAITSEQVPSTKEYCPFFHIFFEMEDGSYLAFFEVPECQPAIKDTNTPDWVEHLALQVADLDALAEAAKRLEVHHVDYIGPVDHGTVQSLYFHDPDGHRLELAARVNDEIRAAQALRADEMLAAWNRRWHPEIQNSDEDGVEQSIGA